MGAMRETPPRPLQQDTCASSAPRHPNGPQPLLSHLLCRTEGSPSGTKLPYPPRKTTINLPSTCQLRLAYYLDNPHLQQQGAGL
ncbi:hypothetical protein E2C01_010713 [Portunus trituberculatus]|uniref:Uncharacterized protein n=1 Tax=Portunus trituberculatus TaxID=210409 RepID=A0A5B7D9M6_PORTR|nr:hypothetical protein [Portunus trituberculatus]